ncbi:MAG: SUMF1/EgtB/PvdO family nonheme iron enzyme [Lentisphaerae bacterium]|nr:SUMF1/EgtB/PvdO family nonheme iron enzyme [Lentisphaerota bacterium]MBT4815005.1 SUMF1/EgtB/PvdO family nonheme iron enzyme [Lentisphaerota bacterium]MBT5611077.1 SUMF1/EgtB/PvdO family nonheme iron enzyme [Lentisphaerota bacterium]MBT7055332.1 SUMF1/EgtB/PvdO family nonheme iron enzyme [Lentisphaerota bacterium]MBT7840533.1 SUMF1/EgtB/PvdO family nonheme iron enzyme [Lentisphaerota bacterium]
MDRTENDANVEEGSRKCPPPGACGAGTPDTPLSDTPSSEDLNDTLSGTECPGWEDTVTGDMLPLSRQFGNDYSRYCDFQEVGAGGVAQVSSCVDSNLGRRVAFKVLHPHLQDIPAQQVRFIREARVLAQLEHPSIVPVHELGNRDDGRIFFTMKRVRGVTLHYVLERLRLRDPEYADAYPLGRLLEVFSHVCQAVAFAHSRGVIHRDLKPDNVIIGDFGEVQLMDWGLVKVIGTRDEADSPAVKDDPESTAVPPEREGGVGETMEGQISGTPRYMSPEQAMGRISEIDGRSDLYSLGAMLYEMLTLQYYVGGATVRETLRNVVVQIPRPPRRRAPYRSIPRELDAICMKCLAKVREERYASVAYLIHDLEAYSRGREVYACPDTILIKAWKCGRRHPVLSTAFGVGFAVLVMMLAAVVMAREIRYWMLMKEGDRYREEGNAVFEKKSRLFQELVKLRETRVRKEKGSREAELERDVSDLHLRSENKYQTAVILYHRAGERLSERQRAAYADMFNNQIRFALMSQDYTEFKRILNYIRDRLGTNFEHAAPGDRRWLLRVATSLKGDGKLQVDSIPSGAEVTLWEFERREDGTLTPVKAKVLGPTPVQTLGLGKGSYLLGFQHSGCPDVRYPVRIDHGESERVEVFLPDALPEGTAYVPSGPAYVGGTHARYYRLHETPVNGFFISSTEVTFGEYVDFWREQARRGRGTQDMSRVRLAAGDRVFRDAWDADGELVPPLRLDMPVVGVTHASAERYCAWLGTRLGLPCRLPTAVEWEKAARGVDGRPYVWGDHFSESYAFSIDNVAARHSFGLFAPPMSLSLDRSVYGVWDMAGNVREWTLTTFDDGSPFYKIKGGSASTPRHFLHCSAESDIPAAPSDVGFRYVIPLPATADRRPEE